MNNNIPKSRSTAVYKRFKYTIFCTQLLFLAGALNTFLFSDSFIGQHNVPNIAGVRLDVFALGLAAILVQPIYRVLKKGNLEQATVYYFWLVSVVIAATAVLEGGLQSIPVMGFPIIAIFSALYTDRKVFLPICAFFCVVVVLMGVNHHYEWFQGLQTTGAARVFDCLLLVIVSTYVAWMLGTETKQTMSDLKNEHQRVVDSQVLIQRLADTDPLTGLANRMYAKAHFEKMQAERNDNQDKIGLYFIDLDNFKTVNDLFDHQIGDQLLITVAKRLNALAPKDSVVCRLGGDEFLLFLKASASFDYDELAVQVIRSLSKSHTVLGTDAEITASVGIAVIADQTISFDEARKRADMAMNKAKLSESSTYHHYSEVLHKEYMKNLTILSDLKNALSRDLLDLHFQPKISLKTNETTGAEALLRWSRGNPNKLTPDEFIPVIESTELIHDIGAWVLSRACAACKEWHNSGNQISVAVNVSALQLSRNSFYEIVKGALSEHGLAASFLEIELTEHFLIQENAEIQSQLSKLKQLGVKLAIDDFGTGYSNMSYLTRMEVDVLKLDKSFISQIGSSTDSLAIVTAIIEMAGVLGMRVVAEGVEKVSERDVLKRLGCDIGQGFLWSKALPQDSLLEYLDPNSASANEYQSVVAI